MDQKKGFNLKKCANFYEFRGETTKKKGSLLQNLRKKQFLLTNSGVITSTILGVSGLELHFSDTQPVIFFGAQVLLGGHSSCLGGTSSDLGRHSSGMPPMASGLLQVYSNLSNCSYRIFAEEILFEIGFIEEMRTNWGKKEVPQTFFHNFLYLRKYDFIRLTSYHCQPCIQYGYGIHVLTTPKLRQADTSPRQATFFHFRTLQTLRQL